MQKYETADDRELVAMYQDGDEKAFEQLVDRHQDRIYTSAYLIVKDSYRAEDILQDTFAKAVTTIKSGKYNEQGKFLPWIMRIAHNLSIDHFRKSKRYPTIVVEEGKNVFNTLAFCEDSAESVRIKQDTHTLLRALIQALPFEQRQVLIMRHYMDMSFKEIAEATGVSINTSLGRMRYALMNLRKKMEKHRLTYDSDRYKV